MSLSRRNLFAALAGAVACGCARLPVSGPPVALEAEVEVLTESADPGQMLAAAEAWCDYSAPLPKQLAAFALIQEVYHRPDAPPEAALLLARSALLLTGLLEEGEFKQLVAAKGYEAALRSGGEGEDPRAAYYGGTLLGVLIEAAGFAGAGELSRMERILESSLRASGTDYGGPARVLGMLYLRAPAWPLGPGDPDRALELLGRAASEHPEYPENGLFYARALFEENRREDAARALAAAAAALAAGGWGDYAPLWEKELASLRLLLSP